MKIILTESQYKNIKEQLIGVSDYNPTSGKPMPNYGKDLKKVVSNVSADDATDYVSAGLDTIPGLGNLVSFGVDVVHAVTYMYRYFKTNNEDEKAEYFIMGFLTLLTAYVPGTGNLLNITSRSGIKNFIRRTPEEVLRALKKVGLYNQYIFAMQKYKWKFNMGLFLYKVTKGEIEELIPIINNKLTKIAEKVKSTPLEGPVKQFKDIVDIIDSNSEIYKKGLQYT